VTKARDLQTFGNGEDYCFHYRSPVCVYVNTYTHKAQKVVN